VRKIEGERLRSLEGEGSKEFRSADYDLHFIDKSGKFLNKMLKGGEEYGI